MTTITSNILRLSINEPEEDDFEYVVNTAPIFEDIEGTELEPASMAEGDTLYYYFPDIDDEEGDDFSIKVTLIGGRLPAFVTYKVGEDRIKLEPLSGDAGQYGFQIELKDVYGNANRYTFTLDIDPTVETPGEKEDPDSDENGGETISMEDFVKEEVVEDDKGTFYWSFSTVSLLSGISLQFDEPITIPDESALRQELLLFIPIWNYTYSIEGVTNTKLQIGLDISDPASLQA